ncbi:MAG: hypothetical protein AB1546_12660, partial [bacterium]
EKRENLDKAIKAYEVALEVRTRKDFPEQFAMTQNNLGGAYRYLAGVSEGKEKIDYKNKALEAYKKAIEIYKEEYFPEQHMMVKRNIEKIMEID